MAPTRQDTPTIARRPARDLIEAVLETMRRNLEPLRYTTLAPSRYVIYLHPREHARLEGIADILRAETQRALAEELERLNRRPAVVDYIQRLSGRTIAPVTNPASEWHVEFVADPDDELAEGDILIDSELLLPSQPDLGIGEQTRRIRTRHSGHDATVREHAAPREVAAPAEATAARRITPPPPPPVLARLAYEDHSGHHSFDMVTESVTIGRGGMAYPVDLRLAAAVDVSREHARIRRDPQSGSFFLVDLSSLGTTLNGRHVPRGYDEADGTKRLNGAETQLPERARIGLADTVFLDFERVS